ncbi:MAG: hypothetical protein M9962_00605 [Oligoflexia bacterium]|nr:hypothetical protein [Oligoflexia bacterium]
MSSVLNLFLYNYQEKKRFLEERLSSGLVNHYSFSQVKVPQKAVAFLEANQEYINEYKYIHSVSETYFRGRIADDWKSIRSLVPSHTKSILDIGSGIGGINLFLFHALDKPLITFVDKAKREQNGIIYDVIAAGEELLSLNKVPSEKIIGLDASSEQLMSDLKKHTYDFVLSTRALAFTFPYSLYKNVLKESVNSRGVLVTDIVKTENQKVLEKDKLLTDRFSSDGMPSSQKVLAEIEDDFSAKAKIVFETKRFIRIAIQKA